MFDMWPILLSLDAIRRSGGGPITLMAAAQSLIDQHKSASFDPLASMPGAEAQPGLYLPLILGNSIQEGGAEPFVIGQLGTSLDGRIATESGHSHYVNDAENIVHLHRLRALADVVVVGAETVIRDDARLTTRRVDGPSPVRVILDPRGRVPATAAAVSDGGPETLVLTGPGAHEGLEQLGVATVCRMSLDDGANVAGFSPEAIISFLVARGLTHIFVEGGGRLVSAFLAAGCLDRLHVCVAPMIIGSGRPGFILPPIDTLDKAIRAPAALYRQGADVLFDLDLKSTVQR
jgi:diaminohydroxyphosphoribosylaminopyrimidine deaminase / 5-amino-6-(5-phosphoribosylamino)uracil reductase